MRRAAPGIFDHDGLVVLCKTTIEVWQVFRVVHDMKGHGDRRQDDEDRHTHEYLADDGDAAAYYDAGRKNGDMEPFHTDELVSNDIIG